MQFGWDHPYTMTLMGLESGGDPNAVNSLSSARGLFQFIRPTWESLREQHPELNLPPFEEMGADRDAQLRAFDYVTGANYSYLENVLGRQPTNDELYMAHFMGPHYAGQILTAPAGTDLDQLLGRMAGPVRSQNPQLNNVSTSGEIVDFVRGHWDRMAGNTQSAGNTRPTPPATTTPMASRPGSSSPSSGSSSPIRVSSAMDIPDGYEGRVTIGPGPTTPPTHSIVPNTPSSLTGGANITEGPRVGSTPAPRAGSASPSNNNWLGVRELSPIDLSPQNTPMRPDLRKILPGQGTPIPGGPGYPNPAPPLETRTVGPSPGSSTPMLSVGDNSMITRDRLDALRRMSFPMVGVDYLSPIVLNQKPQQQPTGLLDDFQSWITRVGKRIGLI